jgi:hypothetical protein
MKKTLFTTFFVTVIFSMIIYPVIGYPFIGSIYHVDPGAHGHEGGDISELFIAFAVLVGAAIVIWYIRRHRKLSRRNRKQRKTKK